MMWRKWEKEMNNAKEFTPGKVSKNDIHQGIRRWDDGRSDKDGSNYLCLQQSAQIGGIIEDGKAGTTVQDGKEGKQRGGRKLHRSGDVIHGQPYPRSCFGNMFEVVGRGTTATWRSGSHGGGFVLINYQTQTWERSTTVSVNISLSLFPDNTTVLDEELETEVRKTT